MSDGGGERTKKVVLFAILGVALVFSVQLLVDLLQTLVKFVLLFLVMYFMYIMVMGKELSFHELKTFAMDIFSYVNDFWHKITNSN